MIKFSSSFGQNKNMSYNFGKVAEVRRNMDDFLKTNGFSSQEKIVTCVPVHKNKFAVLDEALFKTLAGKSVQDRYLELDGIITNLKNIPVCFKPADCAVIGFEFSSSFVKGGLPARLASGRGISKSEKEEYFGLLHIGFDDYLKGVVTEFRNFVRTGCDLSLRRIHAFPFLQKYRIDYGDFHSDKYDWDFLTKIQEFIEEDENGRFVNFHKAVYNNLVEVFYPEFVEGFGGELIDFGKRDTWELAKEGRGFSHSFSNFHPKFENGRCVVVGENLI